MHLGYERSQPPLEAAGNSNALGNFLNLVKKTLYLLLLSTAAVVSLFLSPARCHVAVAQWLLLQVKREKNK